MPKSVRTTRRRGLFAKHVGGLDVPVDEARGVDDRECAGDRGRRLEDLVDRERRAAPLARSEECVEAEPVDSLEDDVRSLAILTCGIDGDDARALEHRKGLRFVEQRLGRARPHEFERDAPVEETVVRFVHLPHAALPDEPADFVRAAHEVPDAQEARLPA
jgi:hypothetical protein